MSTSVAKMLLGVLLLCHTVLLQAQDRIILANKQHSATEINIEQQNFLRQQLEGLKEYQPDRTQGLIELPVKIHIVQDGATRVDVNTIKAAFERLNRYFLPIYVRFVPLGDFNYINKPDLFDLDKETEETTQIGRAHV